MALLRRKPKAFNRLVHNGELNQECLRLCVKALMAVNGLAFDALELLHSSYVEQVLSCFLFFSILRIQCVAEFEQGYFGLVHNSAQDGFEVAHPMPHRLDLEEICLVITAD